MNDWTDKLLAIALATFMFAAALGALIGIVVVSVHAVTP